MNPDNALHLGDPLPDVFPPDDPMARFVVSMAMASNDIERALRDVQRAGENDDPDFTYRIRLSVGHLVEALDALSSYSQEFGEIRRLINRIPPAGQKHLSEARGTVQRAGSRVLKNVRDNTFHYPSPERRYSPTSDAQLRDAILAMADRGAELLLDEQTGAITYTFADDIALAMTVGKNATTSEDVVRQAEIARDGALSFVLWARALVATYRDTSGHWFGDPVAKEKPTPQEKSSS
jgi:hypothetical protein